MSRNSNQLSVAELLARNGQTPASSGGGRRRRGGRGVSVSELTGDLPAVDAGSAHAAPEDTEEPTGEPAPADNGYAPQAYAGEQFPGAGEPSHSPMSGPITVYNPLVPYQSDTPPDGSPARLGDPGPYGAGADGSVPAEAPARSGRRRRPEPDDEIAVDGYPGAAPATEGPAGQSWEAGPSSSGGGRAARRRAAEAAAAAEAVAASPEAPAGYGQEPPGGYGPEAFGGFGQETPEGYRQDAPGGYGLPPERNGFGAFPAPAGPGTDFGRPDMGPPWPGTDGGPPRLGPPAPATEAWPAPAEDSRPKLERRRRGARPLPDPAPWPEPGDAANPDQATAVWSLAEQNQPLRSGPLDIENPPAEPPPPLGKAERGGRRGKRNGRPDLAPPAGPGPLPPDYGADNGFRDTDMYATDVHGPMPPMPGPMPREHGPETGDFEPDSDIYAVPEDETPAAPRKIGGRSALTGRLGAATGKFTATRSRAGGAGRSRDREEAVDPRKQWIMLGAQSVGAAVAGMLLFKGMELLWEMQPLAALALAVVVILGLVALVRILRRTDDILSTVIAVVVGVFVTLGPLAFLLSTG
ncbi:hypothetical protein [Nocardia sp. NPDC051750]|uniref:hypothetical protein n=1 Tax=Nocardia sp. NPDC051750 TaxID=3364325 RepID=UPI0037999FFC